MACLALAWGIDVMHLNPAVLVPFMWLKLAALGLTLGCVLAGVAIGIAALFAIRHFLLAMDARGVRRHLTNRSSCGHVLGHRQSQVL
jgi:hypothetical protein